jgi:hypothetical protein
LYLLLQRVSSLHAAHYGYQKTLTEGELIAFMQLVVNRLGADELLTPREILRDFTSILNVIQQNPDQDFNSLLGGELFKHTVSNSNETDLTSAAEYLL